MKKAPNSILSVFLLSTVSLLATACTNQTNNFIEAVNQKPVKIPTISDVAIGQNFILINTLEGLFFTGRPQIYDSANLSFSYPDIVKAQKIHFFKSLDNSVVSNEHALSIDAQGVTSCMINQEGLTYCIGEVFNFSTHQFAISKVPDQFVSIEAGGQFDCGYTRNDEVYCMRDGFRAFQSNNNQSNKVLFPDKIIILEVGFTHACAVLANLDVYCWGSSFSGELGVADQITDFGYGSPVPLKLKFPHAITGVKKLSLGKDFSCLLDDQESLYCWGSQRFAQTGTYSTSNQLTPKKISLPGKVLDVVNGYKHLCIKLEKNTDHHIAHYCWGDNRHGQLGLGKNQNWVELKESLLQPIEDGLEIQRIFAGADSTCVLTHAKGLKCFGRNDSMALGYKSELNRTLSHIPSMKWEF